MTFLIDADCPRSIGEKLKQAGYESLDIRDLIPDARDEQIYDLIRKKSYILITRDTDFGNILLFPVPANCGIILLRTLLLPPPRLAELVLDVLKKISPEKILGTLIVVRPGRYRTFRF